MNMFKNIMSFRDLRDARATEVHLVDVRQQLDAINRARESRGAERVRSVAFLKSELRHSLQGADSVLFPRVSFSLSFVPVALTAVIRCNIVLRL